MSPDERLTILESTVSFLANSVDFPTQEELGAVREEIFDELNDINYLIANISNSVGFLENTLYAIATERNINV